MKALKARLKDAQKAKQMLMEKAALDSSFRARKDKDHIYFPLKKSAGIRGFEIVDVSFSKNNPHSSKNLRNLLKGKLSAEEFERLKASYDIIGSIAILEIDEELRRKEKVIAEALLGAVKSIRTVLRKDAGHEGEFRTQKMKFLAGINTRITVHKENNCQIMLDVEKVYFSPRLSTERKRIASLVKDDEDVLVMFSGCGPYPCVIAKNTGARHVTGIEINPMGHKYALKNIGLNKLGNVDFVNADVREEVPRIAGRGKRYDRIVMPAPHNADSFITEAFSVAKKGTMIHYYDFLHEDEFKEAEKKVADACKDAKIRYKVKDFVRCGQHAPRTFRVCLDFEVL